MYTGVLSIFLVISLYRDRAASDHTPPATSRLPRRDLGFPTSAYDGQGADECVRQPTTTAGGLDTCARM